MRRKLIFILCILFSVITYSNEFDGIWKYEDASRNYFVKIDKKEVFLITKFKEIARKDLKVKGILKESDGEMFIELTHLLKVFDWEKIAEKDIEKILIKISDNQLILGDQNYKKSDIKYIIEQDISLNNLVKQKELEDRKIKIRF